MSWVKNTCPLIPLCLLDILKLRRPLSRGPIPWNLAGEVSQETNRSRPFCSWETLPTCLPRPQPRSICSPPPLSPRVLDTLSDTEASKLFLGCSACSSFLFVFVKWSTHFLSLQSSLFANSSLLPCREVPQALELFIPYYSSWRISIKYPFIWSYHGLKEIMSLTYFFPSFSMHHVYILCEVSFLWATYGWLWIFSAMIVF